MYQKAIVPFIDILGFGDAVKQSDADSINRVLDKVQKSTSPLILDEDNKKDDHAEVISFSDSIVRIRKIETKNNQKYPKGMLFQELVSLVQAQGELIDFDIIIRGGVSVGDIYISGGRVFGPGLIQAYELESKYALYPRIIIDPRLIYEHKTGKLLKAKWNRVEDELEIMEKLLRQGDDGMWFINYVEALEDELDEHEMYRIFLRRHREVILAGAQKHSQLNSILSKFVWMANYHNQVIFNLDDDTCESIDLDKDDFIITSKEIPALQYLKP
jgi:hypothetical protein